MTWIMGLVSIASFVLCSVFLIGLLFFVPPITLVICGVLFFLVLRSFWKWMSQTTTPDHSALFPDRGQPAKRRAATMMDLDEDDLPSGPSSLDD